MRKIVGLICSTLMAFYASAQETVMFVEKKQIVDICTSIYFLKDKEKVFSIENVGKDNVESKFTKSESKIPNFGIINYPIWCKFTVQNLTGEQCFLFIKSSTIDSIYLYIPNDSSKSYIVKNTGYYLPLNQRDLPTSTAFVFALPFSPAPQTYYLKIVSRTQVILPMQIGNKDAIWKIINRYQSLEALFFGLLAFAVFYNLFIYISLRQICYLYYVLYGFGLMLSAAYYWGYFALINERLNFLANYYSYSWRGISTTGAVLFIMSFLQTAKHVPRVHRIFKYYIFFLISYWLLELSGLFEWQKLLMLYDITILLMVPLCIYAGFQALRQGFTSAKFFLLAWGVFLFFVCWLMLVYLDVLPPPFFVNYLQQIGAALEMLLLSFALAHRIRSLEEEKLNAQNLLLLALQSNEKILTKRKEELEQEMQETNLDLQNKQEEILRQNEELQSKQEEILRQNEELMARQEEMQRQQSIIEKQNQELILQNSRMKANEAVMQKAYFKLKEAQKTIQSQHEELKKYNENLELQIQERTRQIAQTNAELVRQNSQLEQFAFITAHNLRSPVARILGLANILDTKNIQNPDNQFILEKMVTVAHELESVIKDLNIILDIKKGINQNIEQVKFSEKVEKVMVLLENQIQASKAKIEVDFSQIDSIQSVSPYVESILYNLLSNAIKYRNPKKVPMITVKTEVQADYVVLTVTDNGLGIDLEANKGKIFTLYRRFHDHVEGKGLGLFLIKTQMETLGGEVEIASKLGEGTTFYIFFPKRSS